MAYHNGNYILFNDCIKTSTLYICVINFSIIQRSSTILWFIKSHDIVYVYSVRIQCSSDMSEPKYTRNARQPNTHIRVCIYARARMRIRTYAYTVYTRVPHWYV